MIEQVLNFYRQLNNFEKLVEYVKQELKIAFVNKKWELYFSILKELILCMNNSYILKKVCQLFDIMKFWELHFYNFSAL